MKKIFIVCLMAMVSILSFAEKKIKIGVTLQPYYSFTKNIVKDRAEVVPAVRLDLYDSHSYQPQADDIKNIGKLDVLVVNGIGHDEFIFNILNASAEKNRVKVIYANKNVSLMPIAGTLNSEKILNPHTFISITATIQQVYNIAKELGEIDKENKEFYMTNAREYAKKLRKLKIDALESVKDLKDLDFRVATLHGGYDYLLAEFGIEVRAVVEQVHGAQPSASDLEKIINLIKREKIDVIFGERAYDSKFTETLKKETGVTIRTLSHLTNGPYEEDGFEKFIKIDLDEIVDAMKETAQKRGK